MTCGIGRADGGRQNKWLPVQVQSENNKKFNGEVNTNYKRNDNCRPDPLFSMGFTYTYIYVLFA